MTKRIQTLAALLIITAQCFAKDYYVSKTGSDKNKGTKQLPFLTIQKAASIMKPGDICYISDGIYNESIVPNSSGTEAKPIIFKAAPGAENVTVTGSDPIPAIKWKRESANIFKTKVDMSLGHENQVLLNAKTMVEARWPNIGEDLLERKTSVMDAGSTPENIVDLELPDYDYTGGQVWVHAAQYWLNWTSEINAQGKNTISIENLSPHRNHFMKDRLHVAGEGAEYFVFGIKEALDADNEWYYDENTKELFVYRASGELPTQEYLVKKRMNAFDFSDKQYIEVHDVTIIGATIATNEASESIMLDGLRILYPYYSSQNNINYGAQSDKGVTFSGKRCTIQNSEIAYSTGSCLSVFGEENVVFNCYVHDANFIGSGASCVYLGGKANIISHNTLTRAGRTVLQYSNMYQALIQNNDMSHSGKLTSDLGLTYGNIINGENSEVRYNLLHDNDDDHLDMGLYYDHGTQNIISHHNIVWGIGFSSFHTNHYAAYHLVYNNTFISDIRGFMSTWGNRHRPDLLECRYANNLFKQGVNMTPENYYWNANITGYQDFDENDIMQPAQDGLERGIYIEGITATPKGQKPGIGAIEYEGMTFKAGHDFENPPQNVNFQRSKPKHRNLVANSAFEKEDFLSPWQINEGASVFINSSLQSHKNVDTAQVKMGYRSIALSTKNGEVSQKISDLIPGEEYTFIGHFRVDVGEVGQTGVRLPDGSEYMGPEVERFTSPQVVESGPPSWRRSRLSFIVPEGVTSVEVFARKVSSGQGKIYVDDFGLVRR